MALTAQSIFNTVMLLDNERDLIAGGDEVTRGIVALNTVAKWLESEAQAIEGVLTTDNLLYTVANTESTDWPLTLLRLDALWLIDSDTNRPTRKIEKIQNVGNHVPGFVWPLSEMVGVSSNVVGPPREYHGTGPGGKFYWAPLPGDEYWVRAYGLWAIADDFFETAASEFPYPSTLRGAFAATISDLFRVGLGRDMMDIEGRARGMFRAALKGLRRFDQDGPVSRVYSEVHGA